MFVMTLGASSCGVQHGDAANRAPSHGHEASLGFVFALCKPALYVEIDLPEFSLQVAAGKDAHDKACSASDNAERMRPILA